MNRRGFALLLALMLAVPAAGLAGGTWYTFPEDRVPDSLGYIVTDYSGTVTMTFLGDCTLGGETATRNSYRGFLHTIDKYGYSWPLQGLTGLTASDDITVANLEVVLTDRELAADPKLFNFSGPTAYTEILTSGSVECVTLANNHSHDYGEAGYADTKAALDAAGIARFGTDEMTVWVNDEGLMIGFVGVSGSLSGDRGKKYAAQMKALKDLGCAATVTVMHAGTEYSYQPDGYQKQIRDRAVAAGTTLIVGHHPHVPQGYEIRDGVPVVWSLGNCSFGGNYNPKDYNALVLRTEMTFEEGELKETVLRFYPIRVSSREDYNDYSPILLSGRQAEKALKRLEENTGCSFGEFDSEKGAAVVCAAP